MSIPQKGTPRQSGFGPHAADWRPNPAPAPIFVPVMSSSDVRAMAEQQEAIALVNQWLLEEGANLS